MSPDWTAILSHPATAAILGLAILLLITRLLTAQPTRPQDGAQPIPAVPYYLPYLGHLPSLLFNAENFLKTCCITYPSGIFTLNLFGKRHTILSDPGLISALLAQPTTNIDAEPLRKRSLVSIFGYPRRDLAALDRATPALHALSHAHLLTEPSPRALLAQTAHKLRQNATNLTSSNPSPVDQMPWEKSASLSLTSNPHGESLVEASLLPLLRDFCAFTTTETFLGTDFLANSPEFFDDLWVVDRAVPLLATGLPRWVPIPRLTRAHIARRRNLARLEAFHQALETVAEGGEPGSEWSGLEDVGDLVKARVAVYRKCGMSIKGRAVCENCLMWAVNAKSSGLVFWLVNRIYADRVLLATIREEIAPHITIAQPKSDLPISEPPHISRLDVQGLCEKCPLLKSCYLESLRLDTASWSLRVVQKDLVLKGSKQDAPVWQLRKGNFVHAAHCLHTTDPKYFVDPMVFKPDRHPEYDVKNEASIEMGSMRPYGGVSNMCKGRTFAFQEAMVFVAAIVAMWEIEPRGGGPWKMPKHRMASGVYSTDDDIRVWVKRRKLPQDT